MSGIKSISFLNTGVTKSGGK